MTRKINILLFIIAMSLGLEGCAWVSLHSYHETEIKVSYKDTGQPAAMLPIRVRYWYDSYGVFYDFRKPPDVSTNLNENGEVLLDLADYSYGIDLDVGESGFRIKKEIIQNGGKLKGTQNHREVEIRLIPRALAMQSSSSNPQELITYPPEKVEISQPAISDKPVDVWLMPLEGFPPEYTRELEKKFSAELGLNVRATVHAGRTAKMFSPSGQIIAERVRDELRIPLQRLYDITPKTIIVALTLDDLNGEDGGTRFAFAMHFPPERLSVVSMARLSDKFFGKIDVPSITKLRLYKMVKKAIGLQYYGYARSTDLKSVLYSPVMNLDDLDAAGTSF